MIDLVIIGGGPAALTAAIYTAREGLDVRIFEKKVIGGLVATSDFVDNFPGFDEGISGLELSRKMRKQALKFGAKIDFGEASEVRAEKENIEIVIDGKIVKARSVLVATGNSYRKLNVPGEEELIGRGIHFCATCDGPFYANKEIIAIGGGDTAIQDALFLAKFSKVKLLVRNKISAQKFLKDKLEIAISEDKIEVLLKTQVEEFVCEKGRLSGLTIRNESGAQKIAADGVFEFVGLDPNTDFLKNSGILLDETNAIIVNDEMKTSVNGIFAAGDVVSGTEKQAIIAAGTGASAALKIRDYLNE